MIMDVTLTHYKTSTPKTREIQREHQVDRDRQNRCRILKIEKRRSLKCVTRYSFNSLVMKSYPAKQIKSTYYSRGNGQE